MIRPCLLIIGPPASGKSTLAEQLQHQLNWSRLPLGDLIRNAIKNNMIPADDFEVIQKAIRGTGLFPAHWIRSLINEYLLKDEEASTLIIDVNGPPIIEALQGTKVRIDMTILLKCDRNVRLARLVQRYSDKQRVDDLPEIFRNRNILYDEHEVNYLEKLKNICEIYSIESEKTKPEILEICLDAITRFILAEQKRKE